jgi:hypothetical protein
MFLSDVFERFVARSPISVMARAAMEHALAEEALDALFVQHSGQQYTRSLLFSSVVDLMGAVVSKSQPSVHAAFKAVAGTLPVSITSFYNKLNGIEPNVTARLVGHTATRLGAVVAETGGQLPELLPGYRVRILDGNHFAATERRLQVLRGSIAGPLPGHALVVLDPSLMLVTDMIPCEDGHAQERSLSSDILGLVAPKDIWVADRNFCTTTLLFGMAKRDAFFLMRHHASLPIASSGPEKECGTTDTATVFEQSVTIHNAAKESMVLRRIILRLDKPTRDGDREMSILTNVPEEVASAVEVANLYRKRWKLETVFQALTQMLEGEINALGYPRAALLGFGLALATYNILSTVQAALRGAFGVDKIQEEVSAYYIANEARAVLPGMGIVLEDATWEPFGTIAPADFARHMVKWAGLVNLARFTRRKRGVKKPVPRRTLFPDHGHVSTARLLAARGKKAP